MIKPKWRRQNRHGKRMEAMRKTIRVHYEPPVRTLNGWDMRIAGTETKIEQEDCDMVNNNLMSRENQIEEMAKATMKHCKIDNQCGSCHWSTCNECLSEVLYNAGYQKQIVGQWKKISQKYPRYVCTSCNHLYNSKGYNYCPNCGAKMI